MNAGRHGPENLWGDRLAPAAGETQRLDVGPLTIWLRGVENELWVAFTRSGENAPASRELPADVSWSRWALHEDQRHLRVSPVFPDRPLVVKPEHAFTLTRRARARIYMRVPVWVRLEAMARPGGNPTRLTEIPTVHLSDTWWGDFLDGELAYWLTTKGRRSITPDLFEPHLVMSALQMDNVSGDDLTVDKLSLRVEHLSIYAKDGWLWAEEVRVEYNGEDEGSEIHMDDQPPAEAGGAVEISPARHQARSFRTRTFARLKALSGWGG